MKQVSFIILFVITTHYGIGQNIPNWTKYDTDSTSYTLYNLLAQKNIVVLDFGALWCYACRSAMPKLDTIWRQYNTGQNGVYVFDMDVDDNETVQQINTYKSSHNIIYPSFSKCASDYNFYAPIYDASDLIPFFVLIYPDTSNPVNSSVCWYKTDYGYADSISSEIAKVISNHGCNASGIENIGGNTFQLSVYPNPTIDNIVNISYHLESSASVKISVIDYLGRQVFTYSEEQESIGEHEKQLDLADLSSGLYIIISNINGQLITNKLIKI